MNNRLGKLSILNFYIFKKKIKKLYIKDFIMHRNINFATKKID